MTSSLPMVYILVLVVGLHSINLQPNSTLAVVGLLSSRVSPEQLTAQ